MPTKDKRRGRPAGQSDARDRILSSARKLFADNGSNNTSIRAIAADAGVDSALVHHYFGTKAQLFVAAVDVPIDPERVLDVLRNTPVDELGRAIPTAVLSLWESEIGARMQATLRAALAGDEISIFATFLRTIVLEVIASRVDSPPGTGIVRAEFVATQILGVIMARYIFRLEPFSTLPIEQVIDTIAETVQRYLTGDLPAIND